MLTTIACELALRRDVPEAHCGEDGYRQVEGAGVVEWLAEMCIGALGKR